MKILIVFHKLKKKGGAVLQILKISKQLQNLGNEVHVFSIDDHIANINPVKIVRKASPFLKDTIDKIKPDIILTSDPYFTTMTANSATQKQIPIVLRIGAVYDAFYAGRLVEKIRLLKKGIVYIFTKWLLRKKSKLIFKHIDKIVFNSEFLQKKYTKVTSNSIVIYNGVETSSIEPRVFEEEIKLVFCGRIEPRKSIEIILETSKALSEREIKHSLTLIGDTSYNKQYWQRLENYIEQNNLWKFIEIKGHVANEDLPKILQEHDVLLFSTDDRNFPITEGLPNVIIEGMANGLVPIATGVAGVPEIIGQECGFLVNPNPEEYVNAIEILLNDTDKFYKMKINSIEHIKQNFAISKTAEKYFELFSELLN